MTHIIVWSGFTVGMVLGGLFFYVLRKDSLGLGLAAWGSLCAGIVLALVSWRLS